MKRLLGVILAGMLIAGCGGPDRAQGGMLLGEMNMNGSSGEMDGMLYGSDPLFQNERSRETSPSPAPPERPDAEPGVQQFIAYSHSIGLRLPKGGVDAMMQTHVNACKSAGTDTCIVINSNIYNANDDYVSGNVSLRASPDWIDTFLGAVDEATETAGGEITSRSTSAEDLTRSIIDTGSRLDAQKTLQKRLEGLLARRDGELGDLLQIERELARVTGDIESIQAQLKALRLRVAMSSLDINYETKREPFSASRGNPLGEAIGDFFYNLSAALGGVITAFAIGLPWLILVGILMFIWLRAIWPWVRRRRKPKA